MTMENDLSNYKQNKNLQYPPEQKDGLDLSMLALDLSRKKDVTCAKLPDITEKINCITGVPFFTLPNEQCKETNFPEKKRQISIPSNSTMLSPYSESNSPKRMKTESIDNYKNSSQMNNNIALTNLPVIASPVIIPQQPLLGAFPNEATKISTIPTISHTQTSFMTHNEAEKNISLTVPECLTSTDVRLATPSHNTIKKIARPFKAYPKNLLSINHPDHNSNEDYAQFRKTVLEEMKKNHGNTSNAKMRRVSKSPGLPTSTVDLERDSAYWERRRKNNEAAKRSREARRAKEDELAIRAAFLEQENAILKQRIKMLEQSFENFKYKYLIPLNGSGFSCEL